MTVEIRRVRRVDISAGDPEIKHFPTEPGGRFAVTLRDEETREERVMEVSFQELRDPERFVRAVTEKSGFTYEHFGGKTPSLMTWSGYIDEFLAGNYPLD